MSLSDERKSLPIHSVNWKSFPQFILFEEDVKKHTQAFIERLKEKDLYRSLVEKYGKVKFFSLETCDVVDLIEEYYNNKIKETADEEFGPKILKKMEKKE